MVILTEEQWGTIIVSILQIWFEVERVACLRSDGSKLWPMDWIFLTMCGSLFQSSHTDLHQAMNAEPMMGKRSGCLAQVSEIRRKVV